MWTYVYYSIYLDQIDTSNHNAIEKYVYEKVSVNKYTYLNYVSGMLCTTVQGILVYIP